MIFYEIYRIFVFQQIQNNRDMFNCNSLNLMLASKFDNIRVILKNIELDLINILELAFTNLRKSYLRINKVIGDK